MTPSQPMIPFVKASACGNDFLIVDGSYVPADIGSLSKRMCDRHRGIGADGVLRVVRSENAPESSDEAEVSDRQRREIEYHRDRAAAHAHFATGRVDLSAVTSAHYRWWNAYWVILRKAKNLGLAGKNVLVVGCGFGDDAIQLAHLGASIKAVDISAESVAIARQRADASAALVDFEVSPAEKLPYADETFDLVYLPDVVHHLDIAAAMREVRRVLKQGGVVLGNEPYTHSWLEVIRQSRLALGVRTGRT